MKKKTIISIIIFIIIILGIYFIYKNIEIKKVEDEYQDYTPEEEISDSQTRQTKIILYFENIETGELETEIKIEEQTGISSGNESASDEEKIKMNLQRAKEKKTNSDEKERQLSIE